VRFSCAASVRPTLYSRPFFRRESQAWSELYNFSEVALIPHIGKINSKSKSQIPNKKTFPTLKESIECRGPGAASLGFVAMEPTQSNYHFVGRHFFLFQPLGLLLKPKQRLIYGAPHAQILMSSFRPTNEGILEPVTDDSPSSKNKKETDQFFSIVA
jgi:hypothetical protein